MQINLQHTIGSSLSIWKEIICRVMVRGWMIRLIELQLRGAAQNWQTKWPPFILPPFGHSVNCRWDIAAKIYLCNSETQLERRLILSEPHYGCTGPISVHGYKYFNTETEGIHQFQHDWAHAAMISFCGFPQCLLPHQSNFFSPGKVVHSVIQCRLLKL